MGHTAQLPVDFFLKDTFILSNDDRFNTFLKYKTNLYFPDSGSQLMLSAYRGSQTNLVPKEQ